MERARVLLVEDNDTDQALVRRALKLAKVDAEIDVARDGVEAILLIERPGFRLPALVLLDIKMPKLSGHDVLRAIRAEARTRHLPVVMLSSAALEGDIRAAYELGCNGYIEKAVDAETFVEAVGIAGRFWVGVNRWPGEE